MCWPTTGRVPASGRGWGRGGARGGGDEGLEPERAERAAVVGDDRDQWLEVALGVALSHVRQRPSGEPLSLGEGEFDCGDGVVVRGRGGVPAQFIGCGKSSNRGLWQADIRL
jgi:hypothetical protein